MMDMSLLLAIDVVPNTEPTPADPNSWEAFATNVLFWVVLMGIFSTVFAILCCFLRLLKGPTLIDRGLAADTISFQIVALIILLTIVLRTLAFFDAALIVALMGFVSTVAFAQYVGRRRSAV